MKDYPSIDQIEIEITAGRGIAIIVEGDSFRDDPYYYRRWFDDRASEVSFYPQDGWSQVLNAVAQLRERVPGMPVYGIRDRDFCEDAELDRAFETHGILCTPRYTLENYLLDPKCWAAVMQIIFDRDPVAAKGWNDEAQVCTFINDAYRNCLGLAAHNWVVKLIAAKYLAQATQQPREYLKHPRALAAAVALLASLCAWGKQLGVTEDLNAVYAEKLAELEQMEFAAWEKQVSGKYVLHALYQQFPLPAGSGRLPLDQFLNLYMNQCYEPPADLSALIERIIAHARP